ncbi:type II toxin-antitoxin system VapC family toxin [Brevundimonas aurifodinae]|uniref:Ribonuclease VapC n=2 Tax=Brevundimonas TaxID=41275 RepID=A0ABV1NS20_9CAUL|nr:MAG: VapC toxin family PIN domain ribonuclease [Brevundimonas sp. 12-68-7]OYX33951.1 MAG: VapC toxin family PIN domain ribonuclease [Brevundimonas subvibrioides]
MFADASALCAILLKEPDAADLARRMEAHAVRVTSPMAVWETVIVISRYLHLPVEAAEAEVEDFLSLMMIEVQAVPPQARRLAIQAYARFGKGRHPAALNFGDCFAYACARNARMPLLYKGDDFAQTDIEPA